MPMIKSPTLLKAAYDATMKIAREAPTTLLEPFSTVFRAFSSDYFVVDTHRHILRRDHAEGALRIPPYGQDQNRWTGTSGHAAGVPAKGGLYCSVQQQATVNEAAHYFQAGREASAAARGVPAPNPLPRTAVLHSKCVVKIRLLGRWLVADLSLRHNPAALSFLDRIGADLAVRAAMQAIAGRSVRVSEQINDPNDCSLARGIGLALAQAGYQGLQVETARMSERSVFERGDNLIFFGAVGQRIPNLSVEEAYLFPLGGSLVRYPVEF
jgi:hypothetical protein